MKTVMGYRARIQVTGNRLWVIGQGQEVLMKKRVWVIDCG
jgi:hypothetical protein